MKFKKSFLILSLLTLSCSGEESPKANAASNGAEDQKAQKIELGDFSFQLKTESAVSDAGISELKYDAASHAVTLVVTYKGCGEAKHSLLFSDICAASYPGQCGAALVRPADFDASCQDDQTEELKVSVPEGIDESYLSVKNKDNKGASVLVDKTGRVKVTLP